MQVIDLGLREYSAVLQFQKELLEKRAKNEVEDTLIFVEHPAVYTLGRAESFIENKLKSSVPVVEAERGGKITFHGPGQIVGYPIFKLTHRDLKKYLRDMERALISTVTEQTNLIVRPCPETLFLEPGQLGTGVWYRDLKLASIGVAVKKWVSYHGFALNVSTDLKYFQAIEPCGFNGKIMTSLQAELLHKLSKEEIQGLIAKIKASLTEKFSKLSDEYLSQEVLERETNPIEGAV